MKRCIDCDYKLSCGKANPNEVCDRYKKSPKTITKLNRAEDGCFEFERLEVSENDV